MTFQRPSPILYLNLKKFMSNWFSFATWQPASLLRDSWTPSMFFWGEGIIALSSALPYTFSSVEIRKKQKTDESLCSVGCFIMVRAQHKSSNNFISLLLLFQHVLLCAYTDDEEIGHPQVFPKLRP
jgi:hypothetical protein